jgi:hypothetical protein
MGKAVWLAAIGALAWAAASNAQAPPARIRGTVQSLDGDALVIATPADGAVRLTLGESTGINGIEPRTPADLAANTFIGATAVRDAGGRWQATEVHIFPESMRGAGEGHYAWDLPESTMTNGAVTGNVAAGGGRSLTVTYAGGSQEIELTPRTVIVGLTAGDRSLLVPGAAVVALAAPAEGGGPATAVAIIAETRGVKPPM